MRDDLVEPRPRLLGGLRLFLLGMRLTTDGLRLATGPTMSCILARYTKTHLRAHVLLDDARCERAVKAEQLPRDTDTAIISALMP